MLRKLLNLKISLLYAVVPVIIAVALLLILKMQPGLLHTSATPIITYVTPDPKAPECGDNSFRLKGFEYIKPLINETRDCESARFATLKDNIKNLVNTETTSGNITTASVYIKSFNAGEDWTAINPRTEYNPASPGKLPVLIAYLKKSESVPGLLDKELLYSKDTRAIPSQSIAFDSIRPGRKYKIRDLLYSMIVNCDNHATALLRDNIDDACYRRIFTDLAMDTNKIADGNYKFKVREFSMFLEVLYNACYLNNQSSEYGSSLLAQCKYKDGILKNLPPQIKMIHKFGEYTSGNDRELHESAIVYINNSAYLITVMTRGRDYNKLSSVIAQISKLVYDYMNISA